MSYVNPIPNMQMNEYHSSLYSSHLSGLYTHFTTLFQQTFTKRFLSLLKDD
ncbi:hypothetical protein SNSL254_A3548 [Salmonella enterica subsp. enterica serovar Newport str. SL254]|uniref:Uncharacterized protein n=1 Tax=Salmonella newport (strain SL254) TaxID=423368 RepID=A0A0H3BPH6_SALNS|nr:hypothetical protein SNSL254_A3548 [Salmonella enterica subsp. enterica serovar Newport str. SL254]AGS31383.1 hypothetical protein SN31241_44120 [Salmonella enterica subsp. enterica serovar Newport str. USMARC-S3124.1]